MNLREEIKNIKSGRKELRNFGLLVGIIFAALGVLPYFFGSGVNVILLAVGLVLVFLGAVIPGLLYWPYRAWMALAVIIGFFMSRLILAILFYAIVTPVGFIARAVGKDFLELKKPDTNSYWSKRSGGPSSPENYERQF